MVLQLQLGSCVDDHEDVLRLLPFLIFAVVVVGFIRVVQWTLRQARVDSDDESAS